ncbi:MAG: ferritin-like domain-containing protein [Myxococcales bacterium]|nr:ferritin-like domain-containing protein [Myxococcales bacterium]
MVSVCFPPSSDEADAGVNCEQDPPSDSCILEGYRCGLASGGSEILCGPVVSDQDGCCYLVAGGCPIGRPFSIGGVARIASLQPGDGWQRPFSVGSDALSYAERLALADSYRQDGLAEHASVASFSRFALQLLAQGAPASLVERALEATRDELRHAELCFGLAKRYDGRALQPGPLPTADALADGTDAVHIAVSLAAEGCIAETVSAQLIAAARDRAHDSAAKSALSRIARDELAHVELAWESLAWLLVQSGDHVRSAVEGVFAQAHRHVGLGSIAPSQHASSTRLADHGYLPVITRRAIATRVLQTVVAPAAVELLRSRRVA